MPHLVILRDENGNEYEYYPEHSDGGRIAPAEKLPMISLDCSQTVWKSRIQFLNFEEREKILVKKRKKFCPIDQCSPDLLEKVKEIFG